ncbi:maleylacetate reductase [Microbacterium sp. A196]|uniref:maleylacetate reductase n=1 Tax=unclassified Microbacterium TaxID=2609290 RepID=UPI003FD39DAA
MTIAFDHTTLPQRVLFGTGQAVELLERVVEEHGFQRVLLIGDAFTVALTDEIVDRVSVAARIDDVVQHVPAENARQAVELAGSTAADAVISVGGGSSTGLAKIVARDTGLPIIAVPTTFAGSEATDVWGLTEDDRKVTGVDPKVLPAAIVYDASLSATLPAHLAAASAMNAMAHAVDGLWAPRADPINTAMGAESLRTLVAGLRGLSADAADLEAREKTLYGAYLAAVAFASAGSGMHHKICHVLGGAYGLSHSEMHAIVLPYVTAFNSPAAPAAADRILSAVGGTSAARGLFELRRESGIAGSLAEIGLKESDLPEAAELSAKAIPASNPRPVTAADVERLLRAAWAGEEVQ